jgi:hypothetical protein
LPPIVLLECVKDGQNGAYRGDDYDDDRQQRESIVGGGWKPFDQPPRQPEVGGVQNDPGEDCAGSAAPRPVGAGKPFVERQQTQFRAETREKEEADADLNGGVQSRGAGDERGKVERRGLKAKNCDRKEERDCADF